MRLWTVGHSTHTLDAFMTLLSKHALAQVADVRTVPESRRHPQFRKAALTQSLPAHGIAYAHLARLGGWRRADPHSPNDAWRNLSFRGYADYALSDEFAAGLAQLRELGASRPTVMMCSEALWWRCHRRLIADHLVVAGDTVCHIDSGGRGSVHVLTSFASVDRDGLITYPAPPDDAPAGG